MTAGFVHVVSATAVPCWASKRHAVRAGQDAPSGRLCGCGGGGLRRSAHRGGTGDGGVADGGLAHGAGACRRRGGGHCEGVCGAPGRAAAPETPDVLKVPLSTLVSTALVDDVAFWRAPGRPQAVLAWEQAHLPRRFMPGDADFGPPSWDRTFSLSPVPGVLNARDLVVEVAAAGNGQTGIRVDAQVSWQPPRPAAERVPSAARVVTITQLPGLDPFLARAGGPPLALAQGPRACGTVQFSVGGEPQPALQITGSFIPQALKLGDLNWKIR
jgi:hypothetical protein